MNSIAILKQVEQDWKTVRPDLDPQPMVAILAILRTALAVQRKTEILFAEYGLNTATFGVLATLRRSAPLEGMTLSHLAQFVLVTPSAITNRIDQLERRNLVQRCHVLGDRRSFRVKLTTQGRQLVDEILPRHLENEQHMLANLTIAEQQQLYDLLIKLLMGVEE